MTHPTDIPDRLKHSDVWLDWIGNYRAGWEKKLAREATERAEIEWVCEWVAAMALSMQHADPAARTEACAAITDEMRRAGIWPPAQLEASEPTA